MDIVDDAMRQLSLRGRVVYRIERRGDWASELPDAGLFQLHCLLEGRCWYNTVDGDMPTGLSSGDVLVRPRGGPLSLQTLHHRHPEPMVNRFEYDTLPIGELRPRMLMLGVEIERIGGNTHPLISGLPETALVRRAHFAEAGIRQHAGFLIDQVFAESRQVESPILDRFVEVLMIQVMKAHYDTNEPSHGFIRGLRDPALRRAIAAIHQNPGFNWSLERLADVAGMSRSTFSRHFTQVTGIPAMHYLTLWRMHTALDQLKSGSTDIDHLAQTAGYLSTSAFQKAFKRIHGFTPSQAGLLAS